MYHAKDKYALWFAWTSHICSMQSALTTPLNKLETHDAVYYANCTHCVSEKKLCSIQNTLCICMHHSEFKQIFWLRRCHMKVSAYFAQGKRNEWEFSRCPCLNSFFQNWRTHEHWSGPCKSRMNIFHKAFSLHFMVGKTQFYGGGLLEFAITAIREIFCGINI